ncbi:MAG: hypothetical protein A2Y69_12500 [Candidatus Aminicenantes bacterium RBG_13_59_9]|nr:MAG: hypothetical protein A2Y69_12500 [Candidatus Aminicenantes bacterium RBG_13_59_9]
MPSEAISLRRFFQRPYSLSLDAKRDFFKSFLTGLFVSAFLLVFQPFGLSGNEPGLKSLLISGYGLVSFLAIAFNLILVPRVLNKIFDEERWTAGREVLWFLWIVFSVGLTNFLFAFLVNAVHPFFKPGFDPLPYLLLFQFMSLVVALFPIVFWTLWNQSRRLKHNLQTAREISEKVLARGSLPTTEAASSRPVVLTAENGKDRYAFDAGSILFIAAGGNYVEVTEQGEKAGTVLIRSSLGKVEKQLSGFPFFFRCHRAFIVNLAEIRKATGNAQGLKLDLAGSDKKIPVARRYTRAFKERLGAT